MVLAADVDDRPSVVRLAHDGADVWKLMLGALNVEVAGCRRVEYKRKVTRLTRVIVIVAFFVPLSGQAPLRIETPAALTQLIKRVDPIVPPAAAKASIGGTVIADVLIGP